MKLFGSRMKEVMKKLSGVFLLCVMTAVVALKQPAFKYCLCMESLMLADCECVEEVVVKTCGSCCEAEEPAETVCKTHGEPEDCFVTISYDSGDFVSGGQFDFAGSVELAELVRCDCLLIDSFEVEGCHMARGSPQLSPTFFSEPLFVRFSSFLI